MAISPLPIRARCRCLWGIAAVCLVAGCEIRDEPVQPGAISSDRLLRADTPALAGMLGRTTDGSGPSRRSLEYIEDFDAGLKRAAAESKPLLVICRAGWCRWSAEMTQGPLADPRIIRLSAGFVCVMVDADRHAETCRTLGVTGFPTIIILGPTGDERTRSTGRPSTEKLAAALEAGLRPAVASGDGNPRR